MCPHCGSLLYEGRCRFYLCRSDGGYKARLESARAEELADNLGVSYGEACGMRERWRKAREKGE